ncbi:carboxymuconolactone decarboxylase family protein [Flavobacterium litorale]|uniref:Carboxymuconolactone decarboxylase family protein n=1 Tax=Flavobacterium litorale TaxID=2856519 RepID=A0ABX8V7Q2_9FLAO|nr:carboxymuconolactone decarboxylase family protein [Flavobacterium litorale]QYJ68153.1 carboxymuconolactone decarboxylase family protein [Flavobacterium litorale]
MKNFTVPTREDVSENNQAIFDNLKKGIGMVPNLYAYFTKSETALQDYLTLQNRKTSLRPKEKEVVNLVVSQVNACDYCLAAHTTIGKMNGFTDEEILEIRKGTAGFNSKLDALAKFTKDIAVNRGRASQANTEALLEAGYTETSLVDIILLIGDKTISNFIYGAAQFPVDFPAAPALYGVEAV